MAVLHHLFALVSESGVPTPFRIPLSADLQKELAVLFDTQRDDFMEDVTPVAFDAAYNVDSDEVFRLSGFSPPTSYLDAAATPDRWQTLSLYDEAAIKGMMCSIHDAKTKKTTLLFQRFTRSRLLKKSFTILQSQNSYRKLADPGLTLDTHLAAVYEGDKLFFKSYQACGSFLNLLTEFNEATDEYVKEVLEHPAITCPDKAAVIDHLDSVMRRRFTALKASGLLDTIDCKKASKSAKDFGIELPVQKDGKKWILVFPTEKQAAKQAIKFLCEDYYHGEITGKKYVTNSHHSL